MMHTHYQRGFICCAVGAITWGLNGAVSQFLFMHYPVDPAWLSAIRMICAGFLLLFLILPKKHRKIGCMLRDPTSLKKLILMTVFGLILCQYSYLSSIKYSNSGTATILQTLCVVFLSLYLAVRFRRRPKNRELLAILLAVAGVYLAATDGNPASMVLSGKGLFWGLAAAVGAVIFPTLSQGLAWQWEAPPVNAVAMIFGGLLLTFTLRLWRAFPVLDQAGWAAVAFIIIVGTVISFSFFIQGVCDIGPLKGTLMGTLEPLVASAVSACWLHTSFHAVELLGYALILSTVFIIMVKPEE
ncbi:DMT family transporter [uncultured Megasphaera sp.]|uniref:DMT family transporter n=1 Tax=uncultured Megasphaera sp. TaxID=165188 RepID=UPI002588A560|nr:DMT family transporter [uncultured Megasphaera sp.]